MDNKFIDFCELYHSEIEDSFNIILNINNSGLYKLSDSIKIQDWAKFCFRNSYKIKKTLFGNIYL